MRALSIAIGCLALALVPACQGSGFNEEAEDAEARVDHYETAAVTYYDGGKYAEAERMFASWVKEQPRNKRARRGLARSKMMQGTPPKLREAEAIFVEIVDLPWQHPERGDISYEVESDLATTYMQLADFYDRDVRDLDRALRSDETVRGASTRRKLQQQVEKRNELLYKAIPLWSSVLKKSKRNQYALSGLAKANLQLGNDSQGIYYAKDYLKLSQESRQWWRKQHDDWVEKVGEENVSRAMRTQLLAKAHGARQKEKLMHLLMASVYMRRQEYRDAVGSYTEVIKIDSSVPAAYIERAQAYAALSQYGLAIDDIEQYLKITDPERHRNERVNAGDLLQRYKMALNRGTGLSRSGEMPTATGSPGGSFPPADGGFPPPSEPVPVPYPGDNTVPMAPDPGGFPAPPPPNWPDR